MKKSIYNLVIFLLLIAQITFLSGPALAISSLSVKTLHVPQEYGIVKEVFENKPKENNGRIIIHIQDAHCNYEAQKNMAQMLDYLVKEYGLKLIMVEGGSGDVGLSYLRKYSSKGDREKILDKYLKAGQISGEEYLDVVSEYDLELYGIEDKGLYDAHLDSFLKVDSIKEAGLKEIQGLIKAAESLKPRIYGEPLRELEAKMQAYENKSLTLSEYCRYLDEQAMNQRLKFEEYSNISAFASTAGFEKDVDFKQAEAERGALIKELGGLLEAKDIEGLIEKSQAFKDAKIGQYEYYSFLKDISQPKIELKKKYPQLNSYIRYIKVSRDIDTADILKEVSSVSEKLRQAYCVKPQERKLSDIAKGLRILEMVLNLELTPEDYEYFQANRADFSIASCRHFLAESCQGLGLAFPAEQAATVLDKNMEDLSDFYQLGVKREQAFIKNVADKMNQSGEKIAVLITGGFHTPGISRQLKEKGYSYIVTAPVISQSGDSNNIYLSVLRGQKNSYGVSKDNEFNFEEEQ